MAEEALKLGLNPKNFPLKYGIFGAEPWSEEMRRQIQELYSLKAYDIYGLSEPQALVLQQNASINVAHMSRMISSIPK